MITCLKNEIRRCRPLLGTFVEITCSHKNETQANHAIAAAFAAIEHVQRLMSFHEETSEVSRLNALALNQPVSVSCQTYHVLECAKLLYVKSQGIFDITIAPQLM